MHQKFIEGFIKQCEALGVDPEAVVVAAGHAREQLELAKTAQAQAVLAMLARPLLEKRGQGAPAATPPNWEALSTEMGQKAPGSGFWRSLMGTGSRIRDYSKRQNEQFINRGQAASAPVQQQPAVAKTQTPATQKPIV